MEKAIAKQGEILLYIDDNGKEFVDVIVKDETFWLPPNVMAELIAERAILDSRTMGLTSWKAAPDGKGKISHEAAVKKVGRFTRSSERSRTPPIFRNLIARQITT